MADGKFISYLRVSTDRQGQSGLGLEAQRAAVEDWLNGGRHTVLAEFVEVESGRRSDRPKLAEALALCRKRKAKLIVAKLDRLSRNVAFISALMESGVEFVAVDFPQANRLTIHILAAVAEHEREMISKRTREALAAAKARGVKLGGPNKDQIRTLGPQAVKAIARARDARILPVIEAAKANGITTMAAIAGHLNRLGYRTPKKAEFTAMTVFRILKRARIPSEATA
jgi:DNA invertase Pin-like site-specific DNA recombinase